MFYVEQDGFELLVFVGGASLVAPGAVLTAAHKVAPLHCTALVNYCGPGCGDRPQPAGGAVRGVGHPDRGGAASPPGQAGQQSFLSVHLFI